MSILTRGEVLAIDAALRAGVKPGVLSREFGVSYKTVYKISTGANWGWLTGRGEASSPRNLDEDTVLAVRDGLAAGERQSHIARRLGITAQSVNRIALGRSHSRITGIKRR